jgi:hypothetical protein
MRIKLTTSQARQLAPYLDRVQAAAAMGSPGMLVGQIGRDQDNIYGITVAFLDHDKAKIITEAGRDGIPPADPQRKVLERRRIGRLPDVQDD